MRSRRTQRGSFSAYVSAAQNATTGQPIIYDGVEFTRLGDLAIYLPASGRLVLQRPCLCEFESDWAANAAIADQGRISLFLGKNGTLVRRLMDLYPSGASDPGVGASVRTQGAAGDYFQVFCNFVTGSPTAMATGASFNRFSGQLEAL